MYPWDPIWCSRKYAGCVQQDVPYEWDDTHSRSILQVTDEKMHGKEAWRKWCRVSSFASAFNLETGPCRSTFSVCRCLDWEGAPRKGNQQHPGTTSPSRRSACGFLLEDVFNLTSNKYIPVDPRARPRRATPPSLTRHTHLSHPASVADWHLLSLYEFVRLKEAIDNASDCRSPEKVTKIQDCSCR